MQHENRGVQTSDRCWAQLCRHTRPARVRNAPSHNARQKCRVFRLEPSTIRTVTVGSGFTPGSCFNAVRQSCVSARGLIGKPYGSTTSPPVGSFAPPRRFISGIYTPNEKGRSILSCCSPQTGRRGAALIFQCRSYREACTTDRKTPIR